jgi:outer membrane protein assembly factor BamB
MRHVLVSLSFLALAAAARADDWPQFRGPGGRGVSKETGLPVRWSATENVRWKIELPGRGLSSPVIAAGRLYLTACSGSQQERLHVLCYEAATGKLLWQRQFRATGTTLCHEKTCMAAPTPVTDGKHVYALFACQDLVGLDRDGNLLWVRSLTGDYPTVGNNVGMAASPVLWQDVLLVPLENAGESYALGIDKHTGRNRWKVARPRGINWVTPLVYEAGGRAEVAFQTGQDLTAYDPASGKKLWSLTTKPLSTIPSPVFGDGLILTPGAKFLAVRPGEVSDQSRVEWEARKLPAAYASPVHYRGRVYSVSGNGILFCADARTGRPVWDLRLGGQFSASPLAADGKLYLVNEEGTTAVLAAGGDKARVLETNALPEKILASPAAAAGALYLRSDRHLYCIGAKP